ncbi:hypothetical protein [Aphanothece microscopica]|uniref:hypothetical protein n=1 Tax=Aphanothece microscopica TaxID=1049561 RepID=UPI003CE5B9E9
MRGPVSTASRLPNRPSPRPDLDALREQQILVSLVGQLAKAQFQAADPHRTEALWKEVGQLGLDPDRVTHLLYAGVDTEDRGALLALDRAWSETQASERRTSWQAPAWLRTRGFRAGRPSAAHRSARPAAAPSRRAAR